MTAININKTINQFSYKTTKINDNIESCIQKKNIQAIFAC